MNEEFKKIENYDNYSVSNFGQVRNDDTERILKPAKNSTGYLTVVLTKNYERTTFKNHRLVAAAFIPNPENKPVVDHINSDILDNRVENLRWATTQESTRNRKKHKGASSAFKGVSSDGNQWRCRIRANGKCIEIGRFKEEKVAAEAYNTYIKEHTLDEFFPMNEFHEK